MYRVSTWVLLGIIVAAISGWMLRGGSLDAARVAGWSDLSSWGWGGKKGGITVNTDSAAKAVQVAVAEKVAPPAAKPAAKEQPKPAQTAEAAKKSGTLTVEDAKKGIDIDLNVKLPWATGDGKPAAKPAAAPAPAAPKAAKAGDVEWKVDEPKKAATAAAPAPSKGVPHGSPWPIATEVPNWGAVMKVPAPKTVEAPKAAKAGDVEWKVEEPKKSAAAGPAKVVTNSMPWPIATEVPNWGAVMKVRVPAAVEAPKADDVEWTVEEPKKAAAAEPAKGVPHGFAWPIATEVPNWGAVMKVPAPAAAVAPKADDAEWNVEPVKVAAVEPSKGVPHGFPWPIATEVPNWGAVMKVPAPATAAAPKADDVDWNVEPVKVAAVEPAKGVPHPFPWPIATEVPNWGAVMKVPAPVVAEVPVVAEPAKGVPHPFPWPIATEVPKWEVPVKVAVAPAVVEPPKPVIKTVEAAACEDELRRIYKSGTVLFKSSSAEIDTKSTATLDNLAKAAKNCSRVRIRVEGHTDSRGAPAFNQQLSERRAKAIAAYLTGAGVDPGVVSSYGYGQDRPAVANDNEANRQKNRRIEFSVD